MLRPIASNSARSAGVRLAGLPRVRRMSSETRLRSAGSSRPQWSWPARRTSKTISQGARRRRSMLTPYPAYALRHARIARWNFPVAAGVIVGMRIFALLALVAASLALAACGGGSSGGKDAIVSIATKAKVGSIVVDAEGRTL